MTRTWAQWLGVDEETRKAHAAERVLAVEHKHDAALVELRGLMASEEGRAAAQQLAQGGEFGRFGTAEEAASDAYLRRWLAAREWHAHVAYKAIVDHGAWRARNTPRGYIEEERIKRPLEDDKTFLQGVDYEGRAIVIVRVANHFSNKRCLREMRLFSAYIIDALVALCDAERNPQRRVSCMFDMTGCSYANMDVACLRSILGLLSNHYVERLSVMWFYNPPRVFWGLWNASKHLVHEVTRNKIRFIDPSDLAEVQACIPPEVLPGEYGGRAPLRPIAEACRHFGLPPFDGRELHDPIEASEAAARAASEAGRARESLASDRAIAEAGMGMEGEPVDAMVVAEDEAGGAAGAVTKGDAEGGAAAVRAAAA